MTNLSGRRASHNKKSTGVVVDSEREFSKIKEGIKHNQAKIAEFLNQRVGPGDWELTETNVPLEEDGGVVDMIFSCSDGKKEKYILVAVSVPHLSIGQKYLLPTQAKIFQKMRDVAATRIKKAIILVRKGTETISLQSLKVRCPIIEIQLENIIKQSKPERPARARKAEKDEVAEQENNEEREEIREERPSRRGRNKDRDAERAQKQEEEPKKQKNGFSTMSEELLYALKEAIVHESLSTAYKRVNKYIRRGLWHWIEREIMDPNVHFFLIILSSIYQSKTGEILSKKFRTFDNYIENPENVINAIFSRENTLADEIKKNSERHKKALTKFLCCFSAQPPFDYLKSLFLKEFRSTGDGLKARMSVYTTLGQLLARCGFEGEKEVNYPLEILDELKIFQGILCGNYENLRTDNASKKLKHLVPQIDWEAEDIYALRDQLAKILNLPNLEFNLNAYLPQAFMQDAKNMNETRREAMKHGSNKEERNNSRSEERSNEGREEAPAKLSRQERMAMQKQAKLERQAAKRKYDDEYMPKKHQHHDDDIDMPMFSENGDILSEEAIAERSDAEKLIPQEMDNDEVKRILDDPYAFTQPTSKRKHPIPVEEPEEVSNESEQQEEEAQPVVEPTPREVRMKRSRYADVDESRHRHFENFGGIDEDDPDVIRLSLAMAKHDDGMDEGSEENDEYRFKGREEPEYMDDDEEYEEPPTKTMIAQGYHPNRHNNNKQGFRRHRQNNGNNRNNRSDRNDRNDGNRDNGMNNGGNRGSYRNNNNGNNGGYRDHRKFNNNRGGNNGGFHRRPRRNNERE